MDRTPWRGLRLAVPFALAVAAFGRSFGLGSFFSRCRSSRGSGLSFHLLLDGLDGLCDGGVGLNAFVE